MQSATRPSFLLCCALVAASGAAADDTFDFSPPHMHAAGDGAQGVAVADFNADGLLDFVSVNHWGHSITSFLGDGDAVLNYSGEYPTTNYPDAIASGDLDGDGFPEVATVGEYNSNVVAIFRNQGRTQHIRFDAQVLYSVGDSPSDVVMADFDGDGKLDIAVSNRMDSDISILSGNGDGTLGVHRRFTADGWARALVPADLDNDGDLDIATITADVVILLNNGDGTFSAPLHFPCGYMPFDLDVADFNGDGVLDIATANFWNGNVSVLMGNGDGTYQPHFLLQVDASNIERIVTGDFTRDGRADIVVINGLWNTISAFAGNGDGTFGSKQVFTGGSMQRALEKADVDNDGDLDLFIAHLASDAVSVVLNRAEPPQRIPADIKDAEVVFGTRLAGGASDLREADDRYMEGRSQFGFSADEPHLFELLVGAETDLADPHTLDLTIEGHLDHPSGVVKLRLRNWATGGLEPVHQYVAGTSDGVETVDDIDAADRVRSHDDGRIELSIRQSVIATFSLSGFKSFTDQVEIGVR